jgi:ATP-dependent exoDNAse (exonuclease V) alpha subunit
MVTLKSGLGQIYNHVPLPVDRDHVTALSKWFKSQRAWKIAGKIKDTMPDLRPRDAATVHKAQGSTYDTVFIDLGDISNCRNPNMAARLLYVAFTRARSRVVLYGDLAKKYGGVIQ